MNQYLPTDLCKRTSLALLLSLSVACSSHNPRIHAETTVELGASAYFQRGYQDFQQWSNGLESDPETLHKAIADLHRAVLAQPDNVLYQLAHYNAQASAFLNEATFDENALLTLFEHLHPLARTKAITPAFVQYTISSAARAPTETLIQHLQRATRQNPRNPQNWYYLAQRYRDANQFLLGAESARIAAEMAPSAAEYIFEQGENWHAYARSVLHCPAHYKIIAQKAAAQLSQAARTAGENPYLYAYASAAYLTLDLQHLALAQAKRAWNLSQDAVTRTALFNAYFFSAQFEEAWALLDATADDPQYSAFHALRDWHDIVLAAQNPDQQRLERFITHSELADQFGGVNMHLLINPALFSRIDALQEKLEEKRVEKINDYDAQLYKLAGSWRSPEQLLPEEFNTCLRNRVRFYQAMRAKEAADDTHYRKLLAQFLAEDKSFSTERYWAFLLSQTQQSLL